MIKRPNSFIMLQMNGETDEYDLNGQKIQHGGYIGWNDREESQGEIIYNGNKAYFQPVYASVIFEIDFETKSMQIAYDFGYEVEE